MFSASFMDINQVSSTAKEKLVDFELFEIGGSLTPHGWSDRFEVYSASVDSEPTHVTISGINGVILEVHYQNFIIDPENIGAWGVGSSVLKDHCPGCGDGLCCFALSNQILCGSCGGAGPRCDHCFGDFLHIAIGF